MKAEEDASKEVVRKDGSVNLAALRKQTGPPSSRPNSLNVPDRSSSHSRTMSVEDTGDSDSKQSTTPGLMEVEKPSHKEQGDGKVEKGASGLEALKPELFKAACDVIWPVDKNVGNILDIWHAQGFQVPQIAELVQYPKLPGSRNIRACGFVQWKNGPCGMLAAVQAWVIRYYLFASRMTAPAATTPETVKSSSGDVGGGRRPANKQRQQQQQQQPPSIGLSDRRDPTSCTTLSATAPYPPAVSAIHLALVEVIWRSCVEVKTSPASSSDSTSQQQGQGVFVVLSPSGGEEAKKDGGTTSAAPPPQNLLVAHLQAKAAVSGRYPGYRSQLRMVKWKGKDQLSKLVRGNLETLMAPGGIVMLLYSLVLTRGVEKVHAELWSSHTQTLIANGNGYCNQELVNLLLFGQATAGIHDNSNKELSAACGKGIEGPVDIGFFPPKPMAKLLGSYLRAPTLPIWVVLAKSHYSLIFLPSKDGYDPTTFDLFSKNEKKALTLYHYNGLNGLRWREPLDLAKDHKNLRSFKGPRLAYSILRPKKWAMLEKELALKMKQESVLGSSAQDDRWLCPTCTFSNGPSTQTCQMCTTPRPASRGGAAAMEYCVFASRLNNVKLAPRSGEREEKKKGDCGEDAFTVDLDGSYEFQVQRLDGKKPEAAKPEAPWSCGTCTYRNPPSRTLCQMCGTSKAAAARQETHWQCAVCTYRNAVSSSSCQMCSTPNPKPPSSSQQLLDPAQPYQCVSCSVINNPALNPNKCGVCGKIRQRLELCEWRTYDSLPDSMHEEVYKFLPDLMTTMHILWPRTTLIYTGSQPSMTT